MTKARINFAPHAFVYEDAKPGKNYDTNIYAAIYTRRTNECRKSDCFMAGLEPCPDSDPGKINIDPV